ncbi:inhibitor of nuclear factor kappa-B kinase subunit alpha-like isoform X1 [Diorhabda carinulata]|uniref:inhibitor of nuclear factor kappa-B kinase subunit alpha-like isoform X1 n=2 Tax=Diorhabda carinulata TaxID=1163345 RepID=UPI0025A2B9FA|nr:inhibitor of nuclear factor kappa-B kinase subunit alpha-like isoform X1 [Diorhabda carinulata]
MEVGTWKKIADLGSGAFGIVSLWLDTTKEDYAAIKMCKFKTKSNLTPRQIERWRNEVDILRIINHPNIIKFKKIPQELQDYLMQYCCSDMPLLPMEYCRKGNLRRILLKPENLSGLPEEQVRDILEDISSGLQHLHNLKITHRDIKPENIVLEHSEQRETKTVYKIIDLGYAKELGNETVSFVGTLHYLAPEIFEGRNYNNSVDYWSMGILTFEVICGVLPFLPHMTPFERFIKIKQKSPEDICIYNSYSGQVTYSSEMKKENFISTCLKQHIEIWLKRVLTYDQEIRSQNFPNDTKPFDNLQEILKKKIINVFSVSKLEYYSYEITESTLVGTLKDWISRDIKIPTTEFLLIISENSNTKDSDQLFNFVNNNFIYVTRKYFLPEKVIYNYPKLIKEVMKSAAQFNKIHLKALRVQFIFFVTQEKQIASHFNASFPLYLNFLNQTLTKVKNLKNGALSNIKHLVTKIDCYNKIKTNIDNINLRNNEEYKNSINCALRLISAIERSINKYIELNKKIKFVCKKLEILSKITPEIIEIVRSYDLDALHSQALSLIEKTDTNKSVFISGITKSISAVLKVKTDVFKNEKLKSFCNLIGKIMIYSFNLVEWIQNYNRHNEELLKCFEQNKTDHLQILFEAARKPKESDESVCDKVSLSDSLNQELISLPLEYLFKQNQELRYNFENALSSGISLHKKYTNDCLRLL